MVSGDPPNSGPFILVYRFMWDKLGLDGVTLRVFARIYGFCKDGDGEFYESRSATAKFLGTTSRTVTRSINELVEKGLIVQTGAHSLASGNATKCYRLAVPTPRGATPPDKPSPPDGLSPHDDSSSPMRLNPDGSSGPPVTVRHPIGNGK